MHVTLHPCGRAKHYPLAGIDVAFHGAVQHHVRHFHSSLYAAMFADRQGRVALPGRPNVAVDAAVEVQATREFDVTLDARRLTDQGIDGLFGIATEHSSSNSP